MSGNLEVFVYGQLLMFILWVIGVAVTYGRFVQTFKEMSSRLAVVEINQKRIDEHGTTFSQYNIRSEVEKIADHHERIQKLESNARKLDVLVVKIEELDKRLFPNNHKP